MPYEHIAVITSISRRRAYRLHLKQIVKKLSGNLTSVHNDSTCAGGRKTIRRGA